MHSILGGLPIFLFFLAGVRVGAVGIPIENVERTFAEVRTMARDAGRDAGALRLEFVAVPGVTSSPLSGPRFPLWGSLEHLREDIARIRALGTEGLICGLDQGPQTGAAGDDGYASVARRLSPPGAFSGAR